jgi:hypothetical protein
MPEITRTAAEIAAMLIPLGKGGIGHTGRFFRHRLQGMRA